MPPHDAVACMNDSDGGDGPPREGRPVEYPEERFLAALDELGATADVATTGGGVTTDEVADEVGCAYRTAHAKLSSLKDEGRVTSRRIGGQHLWRLSGESADE